MIASLRAERPQRINLSLVALWTAWAMSAAALSINQLLFHGSGIGPGPALGVGSLVAQAAVIILVARGSRSARVFTVVFFVVAILPLQMVARLVADHSLVSAVYIVATFILKGVAVLPLFAPDSNEWFANQSRPGELRS